MAAATDRQFRTLATALGLPALADDPRFTSNPDRVEHREELITELETVLRTRSAQHWFTELSSRGVPCGPINDLAQAFTLADTLGLSPVVPTGEGRTVPQVRNPITLSRTPPTYRTDPPRLGEHGNSDISWH